MRIRYYLIVFVLFFQFHNAHTQVTEKKYSYSEFVKYAIDDFIETDKLNRADSIFTVSLESLNSNILVVSILVEINKLYPGPANKIGTSYGNLPTDYL
jgi:hypothetical protein